MSLLHIFTDSHLVPKEFVFTCLIGIKLIDGVIELSKIICLELCTRDGSMEDEWELEGALESAEWGDEGEPPFDGRTIA